MISGGARAERMGVVVFGDVVESRRDPARASEYLRALCRELEAANRDRLLAGFGFTQGDELQGLLASDADPLEAVLLAALHPQPRPAGAPRLTLRWAVAEGRIEPGSGPATERAGEAFHRARDAIERARARRDLLVVVTGEPGADRLLDAIAPVLGELADGLTVRQRDVARLMVVEGLRQAEVASRLGVSRASVSVTCERARVRSIERLAGAIRALVGAARQALAEERAT